ncbi:MAG: hypothetical protein EX271_12925, partial [Acidimicrobiales bacterium]
MSDENLDNNILLLTDLADDMADSNGSVNKVDEAREAQVWSFQGVHGGAGVTSLVVQMAYDLSVGKGKKKEELPNVLLIDLDFERGNCSSYLDIPPSMKVEELNAAAGRMDEALAQTFIRKCGENLSIIASESELGGNDKVNPHALLALLD